MPSSHGGRDRFTWEQGDIESQRARAVIPLGWFRLGQLFATPGALRAIDETGSELVAYLHRHAMGDWGDVDAEDGLANDRAVRSGARILSAYTLRDRRTKVWIITEADRSSTTILLPDEY